MYDLLDRFSQGIDTDNLHEQARRINREFGKQLLNRPMDDAQRQALRDAATEVRDELEAAYDATDRAVALRHLDAATSHPRAAELADTQAQRLLEMARDYRTIAATVDLNRRPQYLGQVREIRDALAELFGPRAGEPQEVSPRNQYGATRWDQALAAQDRLLHVDTWEPTTPGQPLQKLRVERATLFAGTPMAALFPMIESNLPDMLHPRMTFYWQYFIDDSIGGHYFGGVGPEIIGTLLLTVVAMLVAVPLGIISAAYLVECGGTERSRCGSSARASTRWRACPASSSACSGWRSSCMYLLPKLGGTSKGRASWPAALTLALLVLPVIIRASEEAIRSVPPAYKEASLALGASRLRCFVTVTLPAALPGILTGIILSMSRAAGETAPILFTAGVVVGPIPHSPRRSRRGRCRTAATTWPLSDNMASRVPHNQYGMVMTLILLVLVLNLLAIWLRSRLAREAARASNRGPDFGGSRRHGRGQRHD